MKSEVSVIKSMYASATKAEIMAELPGRVWTAISKHARHKLGLSRTRKAKGLAVIAGLTEGKKQREKKKE